MGLPLSTLLNSAARMGFFSGYTRTVASFSFFTASVVSRYTDRAGVRWAQAATNRVSLRRCGLRSPLRC